jgi:hypothetical protein
VNPGAQSQEQEFGRGSARRRTISALRRVGSRSIDGGKTWNCPGPGHANGDRHASLSVSQGDRGVVVYCHAGCQTEDIVAKLGLATRALFDDPPPTTQSIDWNRGPEKIWGYVDEQGVLLFEVGKFRFVGGPLTTKTFRPRLPGSGRQGWHEGIGDVRRVPYRLPELIAAVESGDDVVFCEGEKDADRLHNDNLVGTTWPGGAHGLTPRILHELVAVFRRRAVDVRIVRDRDEVGARCAARLAAALMDVARTVRVLEAKIGNDYSDHRDAGFTVEDLVEVAIERPETRGEPAPSPGHRGARATANLVDVASVERESVGWLWSPYLPLGKLTIVDGYEGTGKTFLALTLCAAVSRGWALPDESGRPGCVVREPAVALYMSAEDGPGDTLRPRLEACDADLGRIILLTGVTEADGREGFFSLARVEVLEDALERVRPTIVIVDPFLAYLDADANRAREIRPVLTRLTTLAKKYSCAIVLIRHLRKATTDRASHRGVGSVEIIAAVRSQLIIAEDPDAKQQRVIVHGKSSLAPKGPSLSFQIADGAVLWLGRTDLDADQLLAPREAHGQRGAQRPRDEAARVLQQLLANGPIPAEEVKREALKAGVSLRTLVRAKGDIGVRARRVRGDDGVDRWVWSLRH